MYLFLPAKRQSQDDLALAAAARVKTPAACSAAGLMSRCLQRGFWLCGFLIMLTLLCSCGSSKVEEKTEESTIIWETPSAIQAESDQSEVDTETEEVSESVVEIQDFETFAAQEGSEEINLVVWNESTGMQKIIEPDKESSERYIMQDGDRFAVNTQCGTKILRSIRIEDNIIEKNWLAEDGTVVEKFVELPVAQTETGAGRSVVRIAILVGNKDNAEQTSTIYRISK